MQQYLIQERAGPVCTLHLNRPEKKNALTPEMLDEIGAAFTALTDNADIRCVIIRGAGQDAFCSGYDLNQLPLGEAEDSAAGLEENNPLERAFGSIREYPFPVIAMLNGLAFGAGCELAINCDIRIGAENLKAGMPPARFGIVYSAGGLKRFMDVIGVSSTKEMFFTGATYGSNRLRDMGLLDYVVSASKIEAFTFDMAKTIAANAPIALKGTKKIISLISDMGVLIGSDRQTADEWTAISLTSSDLKEGQAAFMEKRFPNFKNR